MAITFLRNRRPSTRYNPRMAGAPSPERPVVLRRLGIIKDPNDSFLQESRTQRETAKDGLELFAAEAESPARLGRSVNVESPARLERSVNAIKPLATRPFGVVWRNPFVLVVAVAVIALVAGLWGVNRLFGSDVSSLQSEAAVAATVGTSAAPSNGTSATAATDRSKRSGSVNTNAANSAIAQGQPAEGSVAEDAGAGIAGPDATTPQPDELDVTALAGTLEAFAAAPPSSQTTAAVDDTLYSEQDRDVVPPQTSEGLPGPTFARWTTRTNAMELIVSETGTVERVRLVTPPQRMPDMMMLSRAKVWKFTPAMKDGRPVRYRLLLTWEVNP
jgi:hypothetical protein